jgi:hypothetical protein
MSDSDPRPSKIDQLKAVAGPWGAIVAIVSALAVPLATYQNTRDTAHASYETLRVAVEKNATEIAACRQDQLNSQAWMEDIAVRLERKQQVAEQTIAGKVSKPKAPKPPPPVLEPAPKPPVAAALPQPSAPLPSFESLGDG